MIDLRKRSVYLYVWVIHFKMTEERTAPWKLVSSFQYRMIEKSSNTNKHATWTFALRKKAETSMIEAPSFVFYLFFLRRHYIVSSYKSLHNLTKKHRIIFDIQNSISYSGEQSIVCATNSFWHNTADRSPRQHVLKTTLCHLSPYPLNWSIASAIILIQKTFFCVSVTSVND